MQLNITVKVQLEEAIEIVKRSIASDYGVDTNEQLTRKIDVEILNVRRDASLQRENKIQLIKFLREGVAANNGYILLTDAKLFVEKYFGWE